MPTMTVSVYNNAMKLLHRSFLFLLFLFGLTFPLFGQERTWHDASGKFQVQAEYLGVVDDKVVLKKQNGNVIRVPLSILSSADREYLDDLNKQPATTTPPIAKQNSSDAESTDIKTSPSAESEAADTPAATEPADAESNIQSTTRTEAEPIEVPSITVTETQIAALPQSLRNRGRSAVWNGPGRHSRCFDCIVRQLARRKRHDS